MRGPRPPRGMVDAARAGWSSVESLVDSTEVTIGNAATKGHGRQGQARRRQPRHVRPAVQARPEPCLRSAAGTSLGQQA